MGCSGTARTTQARSAQEILKEKKKTTTMHSQVGCQASLFADRTHFNMWHDYLNLGRLLKQPCDLRETETGSDGGGRRGPKAARGTRQALHALEEDSKNSSDSDSTNLSSASSFSDTTCTQTSSDFYCRFCKQNGESAEVYRSHRLKADDGRVTCPVLWSYTCPICNATGDNAHTRRYCPQTQRRGGAARPEPRFW